MIPIVLLIVFVLTVNLLQDKQPRCLPKMLRDWSFLPEYLRSLAPYDKFLVKHVLCCKSFKQRSLNDQTPINQTKKDIELNTYTNQGFVDL